MNAPNYKKQVQLLLNILPHISKEECFAIHGGTAINLFIRNMPRLSVDIDLTYLPIEDRKTTLHNMQASLLRIKDCIENNSLGISVQYKADNAKLIIIHRTISIKLDVNLVARGTIHTPKKMALCPKAQEDYSAFVVINIVPFGQLYGGKICAALDRQHPRDLFDIKLLLENEGFSNQVREGFLFCLLSHDRPMHEVLVPRHQDQRKAMRNHFYGMTSMDFSYEDFEYTRSNLIKTIKANLSQMDKEFLLKAQNCEPDWNFYNFARFPAIQWKIQNLRRLKLDNPKKHKILYDTLKEKLEAF